MLEYVQEAFRIARLEGRPVVLGVPYDLQSRPWSSSTAYLLSTAVLPPHSRVTPDPKTLDIVVSKVKQSKKIILIGGRGVELSDAAKSCMTFALSRGALLATTLPARGLFDDDPCALGVAGGFSTPIARAKFSEADLVIAVGASMAYHTSDGGKLFPNATVVQIDPNPVGFNQSLKVADIYLRSDAKLAMDSLLLALADVEKRPSSTWRSDDLAEQLDGEMAGYQSSQIETELLDPRKVGAELNRIIPKEWHIVSGSGHCAHFFSNMRGRGAGRFHCIREFGAIGNGLSYAIGVAVARPDAQIVLLDGDGSLLMHVQELETVRRYGLKLLIGIFNDGAYGSEIHVLRQDGLDEREAIFGRSNFAKLASGFGHRGAIVHNLDELEQQLEAFRKGNDSTIWDIQISDKIIASTYPKQARK